MFTNILPVITGPTGIGKTAVAVKFAQAVGGEIISADSMQVYRELSIGTAKPTCDETKGIPYHLIDHVEPYEQYNLGRFVGEATVLIDEIRSRNAVPIVCGGTGLYLRGLLYGIFEGGEANPQIRAELENMETIYGLEGLYAELLRVDKVSAVRYGNSDRQRIVRALEVYRTTGKPLSSVHQQDPTHAKYRSRVYRLTMSRQKLYGRINNRVDAMVDAGLMEEVQNYVSRGLSEDNPAINALGYRELIEVARGKRPLNSALETMKQKSRNYAKRQETWFRSFHDAVIIECDNKNPEQISGAIIADWEKHQQ